VLLGLLDLVFTFGSMLHRMNYALGFVTGASHAVTLRAAENSLSRASRL
jgi:hypothetical protein